MKTQGQALDLLRAFARYKTHAGYVWAAVMEDDIMCVKCVRENYRQIYRATRTYQNELGLSFVTPLSGWEFYGLTNCGEHDPESGIEICCNCSKVLWGENE